MLTTLDVDSFTWWPKSMGTLANIKNEFEYNQIVSCVYVMQSNPVPNIYLIMNTPSVRADLS